ncbi:MAG: chromate resistance protein [Candidatus Thermoplasmatota archaeon]|jgi:hypothetical protein|nr:chromate resistance protein [Candidatus Thermoplasmatota archaeon]MCL5984911.1 chromate resistance protein [Candidatus Thermoplasmatota archaeon]
MKWVTESRPHVDRCASAWFIQRFVDPKADFRFVNRGEEVPDDCTPYDLPSVPLGHKGSRVTFDAFLAKYPRRDRALARMADLVRDIDLGGFRLTESHGLDTLLFALLLAEPDDQAVLRLTHVLFEGLYRYFGGAERPS